MTGLSPGRSRPWRLGARARKGVLVVHIVSAGAWIGINVVMGVLVFTALLAERGSTRALCYRALELFAVWPLIVAGLLCLAGGGDPPHWFLNLQADPIVDLQVKADRHTARARIASAEERSGLWHIMTETGVPYDEFQAKADHEIPVVVLERVRPAV